MNHEQTTRLGAWIAERLAARDVALEGVEPMSGGSIQENWRVRCRIDGESRAFVLRKDAPATIASSRPRWQEYALIKAAYRVGVLVPEPIGFCDDRTVVGAPFALMACVEGVGLGPRIVKDRTLGGDRALLAEALGRELAKVHTIRAPRADLAFLGRPEPEPARAEVAQLRATLDALGAVRPSIEWGLRWAELHAPPCPAPTLVHRDFRTGNYMVDGQGLTAVLDWEFAAWGDPMSDLGWFCAECWRFGRSELEAGGISARADFYRGYEAGSGAAVDDAAVRYWEVVAHLRWAVVALEQGGRHLSGLEPSLELALTGRIVPELETAVLRATGPETWKTSYAR
jgi:aminoglycoside phosphotransferase (APT) family kinase protein